MRSAGADLKTGGANPSALLPTIMEGHRRMTMINMTKKFIKRLARDEKGLTAVEYAVLGGVIVAGILALQTSFNNGLRDAFAAVFNGVSG
jgi:pilus assembly protein Flp/PilA